jgi:hypothetical protein
MYLGIADCLFTVFVAPGDQDAIWRGQLNYKPALFSSKKLTG